MSKRQLVTLAYICFLNKKITLFLHIIDELKGKKIVFLGSSITYGDASKGVSFADYISKKNGCTMIKKAVSGTTLVDNFPDSYISRLKRIKDTEADLFICQLSTNDATQKKDLGHILDSQKMDDFDTHTVAGAIEYTIAYAKKRWSCPPRDFLHKLQI